MRWVVVSVIVVALGVGTYLLYAQKEPATQQQREAAVASDASQTVVGPTPDLPAVSAQQEQDERHVIEAAAKDLALSDAETTRVLGHLAVMQEGRRKLFSDLAARSITVEAVSKQLRELREAMNRSVETELGPERAKKLIDRIRDAHSAIPVPQP
jgi:hypothetical protein